MLKIGSIVQNRWSKIYGTIEHSSFGFSVHCNTENGLSKTLGVSETEILESWDLVDMPKGCKIAKHGGIVKMETEDMWLFVRTSKSSIGGNNVGMKIMDIDSFIEKYKDFVPGWKTHDIRPIKINSEGGQLLRSLELHEFEEIFAGRICQMGKLLWYYPAEFSTANKYPYFKKAIYKKYGTEANKYFDNESKTFATKSYAEMDMENEEPKGCSYCFNDNCSDECVPEAEPRKANEDEDEVPFF